MLSLTGLFASKSFKIRVLKSKKVHVTLSLKESHVLFQRLLIFQANQTNIILWIIAKYALIVWEKIIQCIVICNVQNVFVFLMRN